MIYTFKLDFSVGKMICELFLQGANLEQLNIAAAQLYQGNYQKSKSMGPPSGSSAPNTGISTSLSLGNLQDDHSNRER